MWLWKSEGREKERNREREREEHTVCGGETSRETKTYCEWVCEREREK